MVEVTRAELETVHERISELKQRVTILETNTPHLVMAIERVEKTVGRLNSNLVRAIWVVFSLFAAVVVKFTVDGGWTVLPPV